MLRNVLVASGLGFMALGCGSDLADEVEVTEWVGTERDVLTKDGSSYAQYNPSCGLCVGTDQFFTSWLVRGGGQGISCSPMYSYLCLDDARLSNVAVRADGSSIVLGSFNGKLEIGADTYQSLKSIHDYPVGWSMNNAFLANVSHDGQVEWSRAFFGTDNSWTYGIAEDSNGNIYFTGTFADPITIGQTTLVSSGSVDVFVAKLDSLGTPVWAVSGGSDIYDYSSDLLVHAGRVYIVGMAGDNATFGSVALTPHGATDAFVAAIDQNTGQWVWGASAGGPGADTAKSLAKAADGSLLVGGNFTGSANLFGQNTTSQGETDGFIAKISTTGSLSWLRKLGGSGDGSIEAITSDSSSGIAVAGWGSGMMTFGSTTSSSMGEDDVFVARLSQSGSVNFVSTMGGDGSDRARGIVVDSSGAVFVTGTFSETAMFGETFLTSAGYADVFLAEIGQGEWKQALRAGGPGDDSPRRLANSGKNKLWVSGRVAAGSTDFAGAPASVDGIADAFLWHLTRATCDY